MYEQRQTRPLSRRKYAERLARHFAVAFAFVLGSLLLGMWGYMHYEGLSWIDAFLNASMLLGGMGPVESPRTAGGKFFAGMYALYAGLAFLVTTGIIFAPMAHRLLHRFHWEIRDR